MNGDGHKNNNINQYLFIVETPSIKRFVFGTDKLIEIIGASVILKGLNENMTEELLKNILGNKNVEKVFANGGSGQFILSNCSEDNVINAGKSLECLYAQETKGRANIIWSYVPLNEDYKKAVKLGHYMMQVKKEILTDVISSVHFPYHRDCDSCSEGLATVMDKKNNEWLCDACCHKRESWKKNLGFWKEFCTYIGNGNLSDDECLKLRPKDFETIGAMSSKDGYIGVIYADGNTMSRLIKEIPTKESFKVFSEGTDEAIKKACYEGLKQCCPEYKGIIPAQILIVGGDDLVVVVPGDRAIEFAIIVTEKFTELTREYFSSDKGLQEILNGKGINISIGIAIGKHSHPFHILLNQAEGLLRLAKKKGSEVSREIPSPSYIDFHITSQSHWTDIEAIREIYTSNNITRTMRPFSIEKSKKLITFAKKLKSNFPSTKLQRLYAASFCNNREMAQLETIRVFTRLNDNERKVLSDILGEFGCFDKMPWHVRDDNYATMIPDIIELADFVR